MTSFRFILILSLIISGWLFMSVSSVQASKHCKQDPNTPGTEYCLLAPIPLDGPQSAPTQNTNAAKFLPGLFRLMIGIATALAVIMIIIGGVQYIATASTEGKGSARQTIENAIWGLLLAISAWLILYTVNPKLVNLNLNITPTPPIVTPPGGGGLGEVRPMTPEEIAEHNRIKQILKDGRVDINNNGQPCTQGQTLGCTNLNGLNPGAIQGLIKLKSDCGCTIRVTGGTEGGHATHGVGTSIVDIGEDAALRSWLVSKKFMVGPAAALVRLSNGILVKMVFERAGQGKSTGDHWHSQF